MDDDLRLDAYLDQVRATIAEHEWAVQGVLADDKPFSYTVGMTPHNRPELVVVGLPHRMAQEILNRSAVRHMSSEILPGQTVDIDFSVQFRVALAPTDAPDRPLGVARRLYGPDKVRAIQLLWPNAAGAYPGEEGWGMGHVQRLDID